MKSREIVHRSETCRSRFSPSENAPKAKIRVFLADDHPLIRIGIAEIIGRESDMEVCGEAGTIAQTMKLIEQSKPDAICVDITLAGEDGIDLIKRIRLHHPAITIVAYTMHENPLWVDRAMQAGAKAYVRKNEAPDILVKTIRLLMRS